MANFNGIAIGINRYQFFQPLGYAQADALALENFWVEEAGFLPEQCLLLTDTSPPVGNRSTNPNRETILSWVEDLCQLPATENDVLWFFFSGYGVSWDGKDYLIPIDGNPAEVAETGIAVRSLFTLLKQRGNAPVVVLLDINRAQAMQGNFPVGEEIIALAKELGISTALSCQLDQFSQETSALNRGFFTTGLLEALRANPFLTLVDLEKYLSNRLPELSEHYLRPLQTPLILIPTSETGNQPILHPDVDVEILNPPLTSSLSSDNIANTNSWESGFQTAEKSADSTFSVQAADTPAEIVSQPGAIIPHPAKNSMTEKEEPNQWQGWLFWSGVTGILLALSLGVWFRYQDAFSGNQTPEQPAVGKVPAPPPKLPTAQQPPPGSPVSVAQASAPSNQPKVTPTPAPTETNRPPKAASLTAPAPKSANSQKNQTVLDKARGIIQPSQASQFSKAIVQAQTIKPGEPLYQEAQADIARWSLVILDLAQGRAQQGNFKEAIAAAKLVPKDNAPAYQKSQQAISNWQKLAKEQETNRQALASAKKLVRPGDASSYNRAIATATKIAPGRPGYTESQQLVVQWSGKIYQIAQGRASQKKFAEAVRTAKLIPEGTPAYNNAQQAIAKWQNNQR